ncbi:MAG: DUF3344 domain-containing protein [Methanoregulaceae archaeon]
MTQTRSGERIKRPAPVGTNRIAEKGSSINYFLYVLCIVLMTGMVLPVAVSATGIDLTISGLVNTAPSSAVFAKEPNTVKVNSVTNSGSDTATGIVVAVYASDVSGTVPVATVTLASLTGGATASPSLIDPTVRDLAGGTVTYTAIVDPDNLIAETDEGNNIRTSSVKPVNYNGYKGKRFWEGGSDITTKYTCDMYGDFVYSTQPGSAYRAVGWTGRTEEWSAGDLPVPDGATVEKAICYVSYNWDTTPGGVPAVAVTFNGDTIAPGTPYTDRSNFGLYPDHRYGLYAIDVTALFDPEGNTLVLTADSGNSNALYPGTLLVVYSDPSRTRKMVFLNEECDVLALSATDYGTTLEEATAYAPFTGMTIDTGSVQAATLHSFAGNAGPNEGNLLFNGVTVATNVWQGTASTVSAEAVDVTDLLGATGNVAGIQGTDSGGIFTLQQVLVVEYVDTRPVAAFTADRTSGIAPLPVRFTDASTGSVTSWAWDFDNDGVVDSTDQNPFHEFATAGTYSVKLEVTGPDGSDEELKVEFITVTAGVLPLPGLTNPPTDPDGDGLYEDLNGNGKAELNDVVRFFRNILWMTMNQPISCFDFNGNGRIDLNDVVHLFREMA